MKPVFWIASSNKDVRSLPEPVRDGFGYAIFLAQLGDKHLDAKPLRGFSGSSVLEIVENFDGDTYRAIYTVRFEGAIYVLHVFQKKSKRGSETPKQDIDLVKARLKLAEEDYRKWQEEMKKK